MTNILFLIKGKAGFVLPKYRNTIYRSIKVGSCFGVIDLVASMLHAKFDVEHWINHKDIL